MGPYALVIHEYGDSMLVRKPLFEWFADIDVCLDQIKLGR